MTKYSIRVKTKTNPNFESIALFADSVPQEVLHECTYSCYTDWEEVTAVECIDLDTGEVLYSTSVDKYDKYYLTKSPTAEEEIPDDVDESNYNPYIGCDDFDQEGYNLCWGEG